MRFHPHFIILSAALLVVLLADPQKVYARGEISDPVTDYLFGQQINFHASLETDQTLSDAVIYIQLEGINQPRPVQANFTPLDANIYRLDYSYPLQNQPLRAFSKINYRFSARFASGQALDGPEWTFYYVDNRFNWQNLSETPFLVHWYEGDLSFAQMVLDDAQNGLLKIQSLLNLPAPSQIDLYIYADPAAMQDTLTFTDNNWVAGHADPDLSVVVVALPFGPDQGLLTEQRVPHELMHILLYHKTGFGYSKLPTWLNEGLASAAELYPNPDYQILLENAYEKHSLLPMLSLCQSFPRDAANTLLAYAQSASFTNYLYRSYGATSLQILVDNYANGVDCDRGAQLALNQSLTQLENQWRREIFGEKNLSNVLLPLLPWLIVSVGVLIIPISLALVQLRRRRRDE